MITLKETEWVPIRKRLAEEYHWKPSVLMIREVMKRELGFTTRMHEEWTSLHGYTNLVYLDFYDEDLELLFRLKYL